MNLPYPPTDNLYKFMAITGVFIYLVAFFPIYLVYDIRQQSIALKGDARVLEIETQYVELLVEDVKRESSWQRLPGDDTAPGETESKQRERPADRTKKIRTLTQEVLARNRDVQIKTSQLKTKLEYIEKLSRANYTLLVLAAVAVVGSSALMGFGFYFWYTRVQKHLDREYQARGQIQPKRVAKRGRKGSGK